MPSDMRDALTLPPLRSGYAAAADLAARRAGLAGAVAAGAFAADPPAEEVMLGGVRALRFAPPGRSLGPSRGTVVHTHGGGYRLGCPDMVGRYAAALAKASGVTVICPTYALAPDAPFPAGIVDGLKVLDALAEAGEERPILAGDSAGGGLAAALTALRVQAGLPPAGLVLLSAWLDLTVAAPSYAANADSDPLFSTASAQEAAELYLQGESPLHPLASPLHGPVEGFPPTLVSVGSGEVLLEDSIAFHAKLVAAGVPAQLDVFPGMEHVAVTRGMELTGSAETLALITRFVDGILEG